MQLEDDVDNIAEGENSEESTIMDYTSESRRASAADHSSDSWRQRVVKNSNGSTIMVRHCQRTVASSNANNLTSGAVPETPM